MYGPCGPPLPGPSSHVRPSHFIASKMTSRLSSVLRSWSVSSMRRTKAPPVWRAQSQLKSAVRTPPMCRYPVGDGAKRTRVLMRDGLARPLR